MHSRARICCQNHAERRGRVGDPCTPGTRQRHPEISARMGYTLVLQLQSESYSLYPTNGGSEMGSSLSHITGTVWVPLDGIVAEVSNRRSRSRHLSILEVST